MSAEVPKKQRVDFEANWLPASRATVVGIVKLVFHRHSAESRAI
jgi:hypothetical protein